MPLNSHTPTSPASERLASGDDRTSAFEQRTTFADAERSDSPHSAPATAAAGGAAPSTAHTNTAGQAGPLTAGIAQPAAPGEIPAGRSIKVPKIKAGLPLRKRPQEARRIAVEVFPQSDSWVVFYREILGVDGVVRQLFQTVEEIRHWESSEEFLEVQEMLTALRSSDSGKGETVEPQRMITVRLPTSVHETLKIEAEEHQTSMNKLCLSKLMMNISSRFIPVESGRIRGRKPGPQGKRKPATDAVEPSATAPVGQELH